MEIVSAIFHYVRLDMLDDWLLEINNMDELTANYTQQMQVGLVEVETK